MLKPFAFLYAQNVLERTHSIFPPIQDGRMWERPGPGGGEEVRGGSSVVAGVGL